MPVYRRCARFSSGLWVRTGSTAGMGCGFFFFFQAEDGIRDLTVTGVQTCALPIWAGGFACQMPEPARLRVHANTATAESFWQENLRAPYLMRKAMSWCLTRQRDG